MGTSSLTLFIILVVLVIVSGFFSGSEIGMMSLNRYRLHHLVKKNNKQAVRVNKMLLHPDKVLSVILIGNTFANILASMVGTLLGQRLWGEMGVYLVTVIVTLVVLVFSEMTPKTIAALYPQQVAFWCSLPLLALQLIFAPLVKLISLITHGILWLMGLSMNQVSKDALTGEELRSVVHEAGSLIPVEHKSMLISLIDLEEAKVEDIMVPRAEIVGIDLEEPWQMILEALETVQHTRIPLYRESIDSIVGMIHTRSVLNLVLEGTLTMETLLKCSENPYFILAGTSLNIQILNFQKVKRRSCFVVDEYGDLQGLVTMEDILEEVVGEFTTDIANLSQDVSPQEDGSVIIDASITLRNLKRLLNWQLPMIGPRTLSGLIIETLGAIPPAECCLKIESYQIEILKVSDHLIKSVRVRKLMKKKK